MNTWPKPWRFAAKMGYEALKLLTGPVWLPVVVIAWVVSYLALAAINAYERS